MGDLNQRWRKNVEIEGRMIRERRELLCLDFRDRYFVRERERERMDK